MMCNANGPSTPGLPSSLAYDAMKNVAFQHAHTLGRVQEIQDFGAQYHSGSDSQSVPFILATFLCTLQPSISIRPPILIATLQHSILSLWLRATQAGFLPLVFKPFPVRTCNFFVMPYFVSTASPFGLAAA